MTCRRIPPEASDFGNPPRKPPGKDRSGGSRPRNQDKGMSESLPGRRGGLPRAFARSATPRPTIGDPSPCPPSRPSRGQARKRERVATRTSRRTSSLPAFHGHSHPGGAVDPLVHRDPPAALFAPSPGRPPPSNTTGAVAAAAAAAFAHQFSARQSTDPVQPLDQSAL